MVDLRRLGAAAAFVLLAAAPAAQTDTCPEALAQAEARYVQGAFDAVEPLLTPCLDAASPSVPAFRLLALARLRQGDITGAKLALLRILALQPGYEPDLVQDPPDYVALTRVVRGQVAADPEPAAETGERPLDSVDPRSTVALPESAPAPAGPASPPSAPSPLADVVEAPESLPVAFRYWAGVGSYGGERGAPGSGPVSEFTNNAGPTFGLGVTLRLGARVRVFGDVEAASYPTLDTPKEGATFVSETFGDSSELSTWIGTGTIGAHILLRRTGVIPYVLLGGGVGVNGGSLETAGLGTAGAGIEVPLFESMGGYIEGSGTVATPARALDAAGDASAQMDLFSGFRLGLRYRVGDS